MIVYLAHGASGDAESMRPHIEGLRRRGIEARAVGLPVGRAEKAVPRYASQVEDITGQVIGGHSYGGRVASLLAAETPPAGLVLLSYPLHRPGHPEWETRIAHWPSITCPILLLSGESDPFAQIDLLRKAAERLGSAELVTYPRIGHGLTPVLDDALDHVSRFVAALRGGASLSAEAG